jgi:hypothetical protein
MAFDVIVPTTRLRDSSFHLIRNSFIDPEPVRRSNGQCSWPTSIAHGDQVAAGTAVTDPVRHACALAAWKRGRSGRRAIT